MNKKASSLAGDPVEGQGAFFIEKVSCPYCGRPVDDDSIERPVDYCHHD